jgi:signal transduction histidine kinase
MMHARIRLAPHWYLGAYAFQMRFLSERLFERFSQDTAKLALYQEALLKVIMLDIALATNAYIHSGFVEKSLADAHAREAARATDALRAKEEEERRREELLHMVVHDVRSPVTAMMASARAGLRRYPEDEEPPGKQFRLIENAGRNVLGIIDNMLTVARMSQGQIPITPESFDVCEVIRSCIEDLRPFAQQTGHGVLVVADQPVEVLALDRMLVRRIIANLLVNAFRHTPVGTHVMVTCRAANARCEIRVADDGPGIPRTVADKLFDDPGAAGHRSDGAYVDSGLGLPFCRLACERLGGSIHAEQSTSRGTCFVVDLPID